MTGHSASTAAFSLPPCPSGACRCQEWVLGWRKVDTSIDSKWQATVGANCQELRNDKRLRACSKAQWNGVDDKLDETVCKVFFFQKGPVEAIPIYMYFRTKRQNKQIRVVKKGIP